MGPTFNVQRKNKINNEDQGSTVPHGECSEQGSRDIDYTTRGARVRVRDAIESIRPFIYAKATM
jgi:hypothetical protein